ncbi:NAD-dependent deacylase [Pararhodobacter sp.]|uniref:NAD-dependent deacylase n=1 Tax=Pararhodobacter sp. TaxID=2127056 RepID=UPI002AFE0C58|nr:NAD-dependent deacylase [Pararhodobacter sp.]
MRIVILTGAGISAESGLGTFRDKGGLWSQYDLEDVATPEGFARNPDLVQRFYNARRANCAAAVPNAAHHALARLEAALPGQVVIVTQNVDDLHVRAGSKAVIQMHGALMRALCADCGHRWPAPATMTTADPCPHCARPATRPDVVWFGEMPYQMEDIAADIERADLFAAIGTSGQVWPAAGFAEAAREAGARCLELNLEPSDVSRSFHEHQYGPATQIVPAWVDRVLARTRT